MTRAMNNPEIVRMLLREVYLSQFAYSQNSNSRETFTEEQVRVRNLIIKFYDAELIDYMERDSLLYILRAIRK